MESLIILVFIAILLLPIILTILKLFLSSILKLFKKESISSKISSFLSKISLFLANFSIIYYFAANLYFGNSSKYENFATLISVGLVIVSNAFRFLKKKSFANFFVLFPYIYLVTTTLYHTLFDYYTLFDLGFLLFIFSLAILLINLLLILLMKLLKKENCEISLTKRFIILKNITLYIFIFSTSLGMFSYALDEKYFVFIDYFFSYIISFCGLASLFLKNKLSKTTLILALTFILLSLLLFNVLNWNFAYPVEDGLKPFYSTFYYWLF